MQQEDLYKHYRTFYVPNNAVIAVAGDFETPKMLERITELFEPIPAVDVQRGNIRVEPSQPGERRVMVEGSGETVYLQIAYRAPAAANSDFFPLSVLDSLLSGPSNLNFFGGGISNKTSRLYRALVEGELAVSVYGGLQATIDPYLYSITVILRPGRTVEEVLSTVENEIAQLQESPPPVEEVARAVKQARALFAYGSESITNQAFWMGFSEMFADYDWFLNYLEALARVTPEGVRQVAQTYLRIQNRTVGVYMPATSEEMLP
jgi:zinc protease